MSEQGEPAFPRDHQHDGHNGMSLRDYFAAQTIPTVTLSNVNLATEEELAQALETAAKVCYGMADAMLKARAA